MYDHLMHVQGMHLRAKSLPLSGSDVEIAKGLAERLALRETELRMRGVPLLAACRRDLEEQAKDMMKAIAQHEEQQRRDGANADESQKAAQARYLSYLTDRKDKFLREVMDVRKMERVFQSGAESDQARH